MTSNRRADWIRARDDFLDPLDKLYPKNPYKSQTQNWRDRILLDEAKGLETNGARLFVVQFALAAAAAERGDDLAAIRQLRELIARPASPSTDSG